MDTCLHELVINNQLNIQYLKENKKLNAKKKHTNISMGKKY